MQPSDIQRYRAETRGTTEKIHFNNAGCSLPPDVVVDTITRYLTEEALHGGYETEARYQEQLDNVYALAARLINAERSEMALVENASTAWHLAFNGIDFKAGDEVITSEMEYVTNLIGFLSLQKSHGIVLRVIPNDEHGNFRLQDLEAAISPRTKLIAITHIASSTGGMMPVTAIGAIARKHTILYLVDACQSIGHVPLDVKEMGCDLLSVTGRKYLRGPRGTGFLFVRQEVQDQLRPILMDGHSLEWINEKEYRTRQDARRFELYEKSRALTLGLGAAIDYALHIGSDRIWPRIRYLSGLARQRLSAINGIQVHDRGDEQSGIVTFSVEGKDANAVKDLLWAKNINVSVARASSTLLFMNKHHLTSIVRASVHYYNTEEEIDALCAAIS